MVTPTAPSSTDGLCYAVGQNSAGSYTIPAAVAGTKYQVKFSVGGVCADKAAGTYSLAVGDDVYIQAVALTGYSLSGTTSWIFVIGGPDGDDCVAPAAPSVTQALCNGPGNLEPGVVHGAGLDGHPVPGVERRGVGERRIGHRERQHVPDDDPVQGGCALLGT